MRERGVVETQILRFRVVENLVNSSLHCQERYRMTMLDAWFLLQLLNRRDTFLVSPKGNEATLNLSKRAKIKSLKSSLTGWSKCIPPNPDSTKKFYLNFSPT